MGARAIMVLGTGSHVGKSLLTTAFCRILRRDGLRVAPFKAQNMSLNSAATPEGGEIGRAQALQAEAAGLAPHVDMNPILLKPVGERRSQVVVLGNIWGEADAREYHTRRTDELFGVVCDAYARLAARHDVIVLEGAGSPAEINLRATDIVNMRMAHAADARCLLVGDIDRGGVFASLYGTLALLDDDDRARIAGTIVNRFRGDLGLFEPALPLLEEKTRRPCFGVVPFLPDVGLEEEDGVGFGGAIAVSRRVWHDADTPQRRTRIAVIAWPAISNFTDFDAPAAESSVELAYVDAPAALEGADLVILPGTKTTLAAMRWLESRGFVATLRACSAFVLGVCGGMQAMGTRVDDPAGVEGGGAETGLGLLPIATALAADKVCERVRGVVTAPQVFGGAFEGRVFSGYEIHVGRTTYEAGAQPFARIVRESDCRELDDGAVAANAAGTYAHGLFGDDAFRASLLAAVRARRGLLPAPAYVPYGATREARLDRLADHVRESVDCVRAFDLRVRA